ncbi:Hypothetical protein CAP_4418 [Chondromyces apiculatus DSM 436]|uniref:Bacterial HORMA domain-containing protein n=2 Tax=Chondromyces apiculatus TaxID=51 RepID=A0A017T6N5_9BACT|nr:Hypothetical protein CAP_4418 [Chondromyces apiculatus DSM 436]
MCWNEAWACLQSDRQEQFRKQLKLQWSASKIDTSHPGLVTVTTRTYTSNAYGLKRETRERP